MKEIKLKVQVEVKATGKKFSPKEFARRLKRLNSSLRSSMSDFTDIIVGSTEASIMGSAPETGNARSFFELYMATYQLTGSFPPNPAESWKSEYRGLPEHDQGMDEEIIRNMIVTSDGVKIFSNAVRAFWQTKVVHTSDGRYLYRGLPHLIDHIKIRLSEYNLYQRIPGSKDGEAVVIATIDGRDIIYMAAILAAPEILKEMKRIAIHEVFG